MCSQYSSVVGLGYFVVHDSNVALLSNRSIEFACSEERLTRVKRDGRIPRASLNSIKHLVTQPSLVVCPYHDTAQYRHVFEQSGLQPSNVAQNEQHTALLKDLGATIFVGHHFSHAAGGYYTSGFDDAIIITYDGGIICEPWLATMWQGKHGQLSPICKLTRRDGAVAAIHYSGVTSLLGFRPVHDEGKITGLAAHGIRHEDCISTLIKAFQAVDEPAAYWNGHFARTFSWIRTQFRDADIAAAIQYITEQKVLEWIRSTIPNALHGNCVLSGGLFANIKLNQKIKELGFQNLYVYPAMGDDGLGLGAALGYTQQTIQLNNVYLGHQYSHEQIRDALTIAGLEYYISSVVEEDIAEILANNLIVARFNGAMEFGPRSLGNRSILASTTDASINTRLNNLLRRTEFMPFAPVTMIEYADRMYPDLKGLEKCTTFMTVATTCSEEMKRCSPAVVHVDGTARPQVLERTVNESYYRILEHYYHLTGVPSLVNTSFNLHGEPIVCSPMDAIYSFIEGAIDYLAIADFLVPHPQLFPEKRLK